MNNYSFNFIELILIFVVAAVFVVLGHSCSYVAGGDVAPAFFRSREIRGIVTEKDSFWQINLEGEEKFTITITDVSGDVPDSLLGDDEIFIDCRGSRCSILKSGDRAIFSCGYEGRINQRNVLVCDLSN